MPDPDDFDQQLRDLTSGQAEPAKFTELSAAERARRQQSPPPPAGRLSRRNARKARQLRKPIGDSGRKRGGQGGGKRKLSAVGSTGRKQSSPSRRRQKLLATLRIIGIVIAFAALLYGLHLLHLGPQ
jgi:hypothetical protein